MAGRIEETKQRYPEPVMNISSDSFYYLLHNLPDQYTFPTEDEVFDAAWIERPEAHPLN